MINVDSIKNVSLSLYRFGGYGDYGGEFKYDMASKYSIHIAKSEWTEDWDAEQAKWEYGKDANILIDSELQSIDYQPKDVGWFTYDVTESIKDVLKGDAVNNGFVLKCSVNGTLQMSGNQSGFYSSEYEDVDLRPKMEVTYSGDLVSNLIKTTNADMSLIEAKDICSFKVQDISGRVLMSANNFKYEEVQALVRNIKGNKILFSTIKSKKGVVLHRKFVANKKF